MFGEKESTGGGWFAWGKPFWDREDEKVPHLLGADGERRSGGEKGGYIMIVKKRGLTALPRRTAAVRAASKTGRGGLQPRNEWISRTTRSLGVP